MPPAVLSLKEDSVSTEQKEEWAPQPVLTQMVSPAPTGNRTTVPRSSSPYPSHYTDRATVISCKNLTRYVRRQGTVTTTVRTQRENVGSGGTTALYRITLAIRRHYEDVRAR